MSDSESELMQLLYGRITLESRGIKRVTWKIDIGVNSARQDMSVAESEWDYLSPKAAEMAARTWAARLGVVLVEDIQRDYDRRKLLPRYQAV